MKFYSVKFALAILVLIPAHIFLCIGKLPPEKWVYLCLGILGIYVTGNIGTKIAKNGVIQKIFQKKNGTDNN